MAYERSLGNSRTVCAELSALSFEVLEQVGGFATIIRFQDHSQSARRGDALVVLDGPEIRFHGMITSVDDAGWAVACDRRGSSLPAGRQ